MELEINKFRKIAGWLIALALLTMFLPSAYGKFTNPEQYEQMGLADWRIIIGIGELFSILLFLFPRTNILGTILLSSYMGGAIIIHMMGATSILVPAGVLIVVWAGSIIRNPELFFRLVNNCPILRFIRR
ncbi:MAG: DoxX family protein [Bacteroidales bacterium]|jgi:hypothetical protein|nr:DoxX family protein [Bacteroidales bacterium]MCK9499131.1 DoxX family protein [Bacteroidales bacterium]MDY0315593.1 DoxX family protein [Bacteroidales bacterium]NLB85817.1 DoxX family protein [Bacteroidales bacterium]